MKISMYGSMLKTLSLKSFSMFNLFLDLLFIYNNDQHVMDHVFNINDKYFFFFIRFFITYHFWASCVLLADVSHNLCMPLFSAFLHYFFWEGECGGGFQLLYIILWTLARLVKNKLKQWKCIIQLHMNI